VVNNATRLRPLARAGSTLSKNLTGLPRSADVFGDNIRFADSESLEVGYWDVAADRILPIALPYRTGWARR
jgi:hypothetical protein